jgi:oligopeptide transport system permease protein
MSEPRTPSSGSARDRSGADSGLLLDDTAVPGAGAPRAESDAVAHAAAPGHGTDGAVELRQASLWSDAWRQLRRNKLFVLSALMLTVLAVMAAFPQLFSSIDPREAGACQLSNSKLAPRGDAWFGNDIQGCDHYANVIYGARVSMIIGLVVVGGSALIGVTLGALAGFFGGWFDVLIARITDIVYGLPIVLGAILILNAFSERGLFQVSVALIALSWMTFLRLFRSSVISVKGADYVSAARSMGATNGRIIIRHILPNALAPVLVYGTIAVGGIIAAEATLSFLGIGLQLPAISWGLQINSGQRLLRTAPHIIFFPSLFLSVTVLCFILLGDALRDALDPKLR